MAALLVVVCVAAGVSAEPLDPARLTWRELRFHARKLIFSAETRVRIELLPAPAVAAELVAGPANETAVAYGDQVVRLGLETSALGRHTRNTAWLAPATGAALQTTSQELGGRARFKSQRFTARGVAVTRHAPGKGEEAEPASRWSGRRESFIAFPEVSLEGIAVSDSPALFWVLAIAELAAPGDRATLAVVTRGRLLEVEAVVRGRTRVDVDYVERRPQGESRIRGTVEVLELRIDARPLGQGAAGGEIEFLGMKGSIRILLDPARRVPLEVSGRVPAAGAVTVRLAEIVPIE